MKKKPSTIERRARKRAEREDPQNKGHGLRWFSLLPFINGEVLHNWATVTSRHH